MYIPTTMLEYFYLASYIADNERTTMATRLYGVTVVPLAQISMRRDYSRQINAVGK